MVIVVPNGACLQPTPPHIVAASGYREGTGGGPLTHLPPYEITPADAWAWYTLEAGGALLPDFTAVV
jgi:hypothetical protein